MPCAPMITAVLMPTTSPREDTSGPPELPGLSAASVWMTSSISRPERARSERPSAETTPVVTVDSKPSGLPIAITSWPRLSSLELPRVAAGSVTGASIAHEREIGVRVVADHARGQAAAVDGGHADARRAADHVAVGEHEPVGRDHDARAGAAMALVAGLRDVEPHHRRTDAVHHVDDGARIGIEQRLVLRRDRRGRL